VGNSVLVSTRRTAITLEYTRPSCRILTTLIFCHSQHVQGTVKIHISRQQQLESFNFAARLHLLRVLAVRQSCRIQHLKMASVTEVEFYMLTFRETKSFETARRERKCGSDLPIVGRRVLWLAPEITRPPSFADDGRMTPDVHHTGLCRSWSSCRPENVAGLWTSVWATCGAQTALRYSATTDFRFKFLLRCLSCKMRLLAT